MEEDCRKVLDGGSWFVIGQLLTVEPWVPNFVLGTNTIQRTVIWIRLPGLPMEYWDKKLLLGIILEVGKPMGLNDFIDRYWKTGFARIRMEVDAAEPLKPGVLIREAHGCFGSHLFTRMYRLCVTSVDG